MKKQYYKFVSVALIATMFVTGCSKNSSDIKDNATNSEAVVTEAVQVPEKDQAPEEAQAPGKIVYRVTPESESDMKMMNIPNAPYWFPAELLEWNPKEAKDLDLYVSNVPLKSRVDKSKLVKSNKTQLADFKVAALSIMNSSTSGNSPHGLNRFNANTFSYWQYVDQLVYWGGSAGEGLIVPPTADVTEAAHTNGVPVLGTIFLAPEAWGGKIVWLDDFLKTDENGQFLLVDKLIEVCTVLGFDGWFINQEVGGTKEAPLTKEYADKMLSFVQQFNEKAAGQFSFIWYDSMTEEGVIDYQNALTEKNDAYLIDENGKKGADSMFLNFWWAARELADQELLVKSNEKAKEKGINPYDLYAGIDVQANGVMTRINWDLFEKNNVPHTSIGLYCPSWTYFAADSLDAFERYENRMWVNEHGDPTIPTEVSQYDWHGISTYAIEKTVVNQLPFITNFNKGNGYNFFVNGEKISLQDWNNRSITDIMPTYRWILNQEEGNKLKPGIDYADAYYGGNSIRLYGAMETDKKSELTLYSSDLAISDKTKAYAMLKANYKVNAELVLELEDGSKEYIKGDNTLNTEWAKIVFDLSKVKGKTVKKIGFNFTSSKSDMILINMGNLTIFEENSAAPTTPGNLKIAYQQFDDDGLFAGVKLAWDGASNVRYYEVYKINDDGSKSFQGATTAKAHYINALVREEGEKKSTFEVIAVNNMQQRSQGTTIVMEWPNISLPKANMKASKTLVAPLEVVEFTSLCSQNTTGYEWSFEGADNATSTEQNPKVTYSKEGVYNVSLVAKNEEGTAEYKVDGLIVVRSDASGDIPVISEGKSTSASSYVNENEAPRFAVDGKTNTKWCATGSAPHDITIDLGEDKMVSEVYMAHAEKGNESPDMNTSWYTIETSLDGKSFELAIEVKNNASAETLDAFKPREARYVKITVIKPTQGSDTAVRIYEIQVHGLDK